MTLRPTITALCASAALFGACQCLDVGPECGPDGCEVPDASGQDAFLEPADAAEPPDGAEPPDAQGPQDAALPPDAAVAADAGMAADASCATQSFTPQADSLIAAAGNNNFGTSPIANIGVGRFLARFPIGASLSTAMAQGRVVQLELSLTRALADPQCGTACPSATGTILAYPLVNSWTEGSGSNSTGVCWTHPRGISLGPAWGAPGADLQGTDRGPRAGFKVADANVPTFTVLLDPPSFDGFVTAGLLSVLLVPDSTVVFVAATKENPTYGRAVLRVTACQ